MSGAQNARPRVQRAVVQQRYGRLDHALAWTADLPVLEPVGHQVQVQTRAAAVNPIDWQMIEGNRRLISRRRFPFIPLFDLAGVVTAVGPEARAFHVGDTVHADNQRNAGGASEYVNVDEQLLAPVPDGLGFAEAAALPLAAQTALSCLDRGEITRGTRVAVIGASGGVGTFAVQMAKALGADVVGVSSARNHALIRTLGAAAVVDRRTTTLAETYPRSSFDVIVDCVGGRGQWDQARAVLAPGGRFVTISRDEDDRVTPASAVRMISTITVRRLRGNVGKRLRYEPIFLSASGSLLRRVDTMVASGQVVAHIGERFPFTLQGVMAALRSSRTGRSVGKTVIEMTT